jgi:hypothetical protein
LMTVSVDSVSTARTVLDHASDLVPDVLAGKTSLHVAGKQARARKKARRAEEPKVSPPRHNEIEESRAGALAEAHQKARSIIANAVGAFAESPGVIWHALGDEELDGTQIKVYLKSARLDGAEIVLESRWLYSTQRPVIKKDDGVEQAFRITAGDLKEVVTKLDGAAA